MPSVLLATCAGLPHGDEDADVLGRALSRLGVSYRWVAWTDPHTDWDETLVVLRSTWDYTGARDAFLAWVAGVRRIANQADVVAWNTDKTYLAELAAAGVPTVESVFLPPGAPIAFPESGEIVVKPSVGAGSRGVGRFVRAEFDSAHRHVASLHGSGRAAVVQPYLDAVASSGETALVYLDGRFSHAVRKGPMLPDGVVHPLSGRELFVEEAIVARTPDPGELAVGAQALQALRERFGVDQLYTRVDLLPSPVGPVVVELELTEPSLFLQHGPAGADGHGAADRFASAIAGRT